MIKVGDLVLILDGSDIEDYECGWAKGMKDYVGQVKRVEWVDGTSCLLEDSEYVWDLRGLEKVNKSPTFSYREIQRLENFLDIVENGSGLALAPHLDRDGTLRTLVVDALKWFTEFYEGE